jgi:16S rRNA (guanine527-N7)-methyltransferase
MFHVKRPLTVPRETLPAVASLTLQQLAQRHHLEPTAPTALATLLDRLGDPGAPTAVHGGVRALEVHVADSLAGLEVAELRQAELLADLGAGAGTPGLVLAVALPRTRVVLIESVARKCAFMRATADAMGLGNVEVVNDRIEAWSAGRDRCDVVCARALAALAVLCEYAAPLLRDRGVLVAWKGAVEPAEAAAGRAAAAELGLTPPEALPVVPFPGSARRTLQVLRKVAPTPARFPRRPGMATKRPLGAR